MRHVEVILYNVVIYGATVNCAVHVLQAALHQLQSMFGVTSVRGEKRYHACVRKSSQIGSGVEWSIYKPLVDTVEEHLV